MQLLNAKQELTIMGYVRHKSVIKQDIKDISRIAKQYAKYVKRIKKGKYEQPYLTYLQVSKNERVTLSVALNEEALLQLVKDEVAKLEHHLALLQKELNLANMGIIGTTNKIEDF